MSGFDCHSVPEETLEAGCLLYATVNSMAMSAIGPNPQLICARAPVRLHSCCSRAGSFSGWQAALLA